MNISRSKTYIVSVRGNLNAVRYCNELTRPMILPFMRHGHAQIFSTGQCTPACRMWHVTRRTCSEQCEPLELAREISDISPIEHLWNHFGRKVRERNDVNNVMDIEQALHQEWNRIPKAVIKMLILSMLRR